MEEKQVKEIATELTLTDMRVINNIIEFVASKGLFKPSDYNTIGNIYEKIKQLLSTNESSS